MLHLGFMYALQYVKLFGATVFFYRIFICYFYFPLFLGVSTGLSYGENILEFNVIQYRIRAIMEGKDWAIRQAKKY
ncbi:hypothetical protein COF44_21755 [Bacillus toyonensis]|nr:hypothetical protein COF44_21755 [Bacillus toyonensis]